MILSRKWLNEFVDCSAWADHDFSEAMTLSGSKVETFTDLHKNIQNVVAGRIVEMVRHTNSDHMWVCQVDVGGSEPLQIVTGAQNQKVGDMVPVALDGSLLPDGKEIHAGMLRGELSNGMMCSLKELGLTLHDYPYAIEDGLWVMQEDGVKPGDDIAAVIGILTVGDGLSGYINSTMSDLGASSIIVTLQEKDREAVSSEDMMSMMVMKQPETTDLMTPEMIAAMQEQFAGRLAATSLSESAGSGKAKDGRLYANVSAMGVNEGYFTVNNVKLSEGRFLQQKDDDGRRMVCVVSDRLVGNLFDGDQKQALGQEVLVKLSGGSYTFRIVGVYKYEQSAISFSIASDKDLATSLYIPLSTAKQLTGASRGYSMITVQAAVGESSTEVAAEVKNYLARYYRTNENYTVTAISMDSMISSVNSMMNTLSVAIAVIAAISLLVGGIGVMNIMLVSVTERTREIGTRKALGATNGNIRIQFVVESVIICLVGGAIGIVLGAVMGYVGSGLLKNAVLPGIGAIALAFGFSLAVGVFFGYYPANKAAMMDPIEALRYE